MAQQGRNWKLEKFSNVRTLKVNIFIHKKEEYTRAYKNLNIVEGWMDHPAATPMIPIWKHFILKIKTKRIVLHSSFPLVVLVLIY